MPCYARIGVAFAWLVDAETHLVFAHRLDAGKWRPIGTYSDETEASRGKLDALAATRVLREQMRAGIGIGVIAARALRRAR